MLIEEINLLKGERFWINKIKSNFLDSKILKKYSIWLKEQNDNRYFFVEKLCEAIDTQDKKKLPILRTEDIEWIEVIGFTYIQQMFLNECIQYKSNIASLAKPCFHISLKKTDDSKIPVGASKFGGNPDLPENMPWPTGNECSSIFIADTKGEKRLAGFIGQINFEDFKQAHESKVIPTSGLLSFFCFQDIENDHVEKIGLGAFYFDQEKSFIRKSPPIELTEGNQLMQANLVQFQEALDLPEKKGSCWSSDYKLDADEYWDFFDYFRYKYFDNFLGYSRGTTTDDQTISKDHQPLVIIENDAGCRLFLQIHKDDLKNKRFDKTIIGCVDFD